jgi:hypothetical protein
VPLLSRWFLRAALVWLLAALLIGVLVAVPSVAVSPVAAGLRPLQTHAHGVGWATQMIFGVGHWMFPRPGAGRSFGSPLLGWSAWGGLNAGLLLRALAEPLQAAGSATALVGPLGVASSALQLAAVLLFAAHLWRRATPLA